MTEKLRIVLDTNVLIYALEGEQKGDRADRRQQVARDVVAFSFTRHRVFVTDETLAELKKVISTPVFRSRHRDQVLAAKRFCERVAKCAERIEAATPEKECKADASDTAFLRAVAGAKAQFLITEDKHLLDEAHSDGARILRIWDFAERVMGVELGASFRFDLAAKIEKPVQVELSEKAKPQVVRDAYGRPKKAAKTGKKQWKTEGAPKAS